HVPIPHEAAIVGRGDLVEKRALHEVDPEIRGELFQAERHFELAGPEPEVLGDQLEVKVDITQWLGVGEIHLQFEVDPREELGIPLQAGAPNEPLLAEVGPCELPGALLGAIEIDLEPPAEIKPEVAIFRLNERAPPVEPDLDG